MMPDATLEKLPESIFPRAVTQGGPVVKKPKIQVITFKGDSLAPQIEAFSKKLETSTYWGELATEYGVGALVNKTPIRLEQAAPTLVAINDIVGFLEQNLTGIAPAFGSPDSDTLYAIYYPAGTKVSDDGLGESCQRFSAFTTRPTWVARRSALRSCLVARFRARRSSIR